MTPARISINLLGVFEALRSDGTSIFVRGERSRALLACLACEDPGSWTRDRLAAILWEGRDLQQARSSLRQELVRLRSDLGQSEASDWNSGSGMVLPKQLSLDVTSFRSAIRDDRAVDAAKLYNGELLPDSKLASRRFQDWITTKRDALRDQAINICLHFLENSGAKSSNGNSADNRSTEGEIVAERLIALDPMSEVGHRWLMRNDFQNRRFLQALERYHDLTRILKRESGQTPSPGTQMLFNEILVSAGRAEQPVAVSEQQSVDWISTINRQHVVAAAPEPRHLLPIHGRPSLAILPFIDNSPNAQSRPMIADGLTEELTTALTRIPGLFVCARQSSMIYKGAAIDIRRIASELGVSYLLEGSVELCDERMRVNARLIDGYSGLHLWAGSYEKIFGDLFVLRNEIISDVIGKLQPALMMVEIRRALDAPPENLTAWTHLQRANGHILFKRQREALSDAVEELKAALALDPDYAMAQALLSAVYTWRSTWTVGNQATQERALAVDLAERANRSDPDNSFVLANCGETALYGSGNIDLALELFDHAVARSPGDAHGIAMLANAQRFAGNDAEQSLNLIEQARRISPRDPRSHRWLHYSGWCHWKLDDFKQMEIASRSAIELYSDAPPQWLELTCALGLQGRTTESRQAGAMLKTLAPGFAPQSFFDLARRFYGRRFPGKTESDYRRLCSKLDDAMGPG